LASADTPDDILPESPTFSMFPSGVVAGPHAGILKPGPSRGPVFFVAAAALVIAPAIHEDVIHKYRRAVRELVRSTVISGNRLAAMQA